MLLEDTFKLGLTGWHTIPLLLLAAGVFLIVYSGVMMEAFRIVTNNSEYRKNKKTGNKPLGYGQLIGILLCIVVLALIYVITGGEGHISYWIDKFISKL